MRKTLSRQVADLDAVFDLLHRFAVEHSLAADLERDLGVIAEELFTNQVRHARPGGDSIEVEVELVDGSIRLELTDENVEPFDPTSAPEVDVDQPVGERKRGGLGIHFVRILSDSFEWNYDPDRRASRITVTRHLER